MKELSSLYINPETKHLFQLYYQLHGVRLSVFTPGGNRIYPEKKQPNCPYCEFVRRELNMEDRCRQLDRRMISLSLEQDRMIRYNCHGGMEEAALPLKKEGKILGCIMLGQFRQEHSGISPYQKRWEQVIGGDRLKRAYEETPVYSSGKIQLLLGVYQGLLDLVIRDNLISQGKLDMLLPLIRELEDNPGWSPTLEEAAGWIGRSPASLTRQFRTITGKSFKQYLIHFKLDRADQMMREQPRRPLNEIAWALGFRDPLYFSRLYKKYRDQTPKSFREQQRCQNEILKQDYSHKNES